MIPGALRRRRICFIFALLICVIMSFSACGSTDNETESAEPAATETAEYESAAAKAAKNVSAAVLEVDKESA